MSKKIFYDIEIKLKLKVKKGSHTYSGSGKEILQVLKQQEFPGKLFHLVTSFCREK